MDARVPRDKGNRAGIVDALSYSAIAFLYDRDMARSVSRVLARVGQALDVVATVLLPLDPGATGWAWPPDHPACAGLHDAITKTPAWNRQLEQGNVVWGNAGQSDHAHALSRCGAASLIMAPVLVGGRLWGVLAALDQSPHAWSQVHHKFMLAVAGIFGGALHSDSQQTRLAESRLHLQAVQTRADSYRIRLDEFILASPDAILLIEPDGFVSRWNKSADQLFAIEATARPGRSYRDILPFAGRPAMADLVDSARHGQACHAYPMEVAGEMGCRNILVSVFPLGDPTGTVVVIAQDQTEAAMFRDKLERSMSATVAALASAVETRDPYTAGHQRRTAELARSIAVAMGLGEDDVRGIQTAAVIHDIGKICVPSELLTCPRRLHEVEMALIRMHSQAGFDIVKGIDFPWPVPQMILQHHERMDGRGYPHGLKGEEILVGARILGVADAVEAITNHRPYRPALGIEAARQVVLDGAGKDFDPEVVRACVDVLDRQGLPLPPQL